MIYSFHSQPVSAIDKWGPSLRLFNEIAKEMGFTRKVEALNTAFRDNAAVISLFRVSGTFIWSIKELIPL